tara:strand:- start:77 stop:319 length:243 start_codon:yes stop_codon:yes gene_type:complete
MNNRTYVIIDSSLVESEDFDFSQVLETSASTLRFSVDGTKTFVKFVGEVPSFLEGLTLRNHDEIRAVLATPEWQAPHDPE